MGCLLLIVGIGGWLSFEARLHEGKNIRGEILRRAGSIASALSMEDIHELACGAENAVTELLPSEFSEPVSLAC